MKKNPKNLKINVSETVFISESIKTFIQQTGELYEKKPLYALASDVVSLASLFIGLFLSNIIVAIIIGVITFLVTHWLANKAYKKIEK